MTDRAVNYEVTSRSLDYIVDPFFTKTQMQHVLVDLSNQKVFVNRTRVQDITKKLCMVLPVVQLWSNSIN